MTFCLVAPLYSRHKNPAHYVVASEGSLESVSIDGECDYDFSSRAPSRARSRKNKVKEIHQNRVLK